MTFEEAFKALKEGKQVRLGKCTCGQILTPDGQNIKPVEENNYRFITIAAALRDDWELVE